MIKTLIRIRNGLVVVLLTVIMIGINRNFLNNNTVEIKQPQSNCCPELTRVSWCWPWDSCYVIGEICKKSIGNKEG